MVLRAKVFSSYQTFSQQMETYIVSTPAVESAATSAALVMANPHRVLTVTGVGLTYDIQGRINGGTVTGVEIEVEGNVKVMEIDGFSLNVAALNGALNAALEANPVWDFDASEIAAANEDGKGATFEGEGGADTLSGSRFADTFSGMGGADSLVGGLGRDWLEGGAGHDTLEGGDDGDYLTGARGNDEIDGGGSADMVVSRGISDQTVDLGRGRLRGENIGRDKLFSIESFFAGSGDDKITGSDRANTLIGGFGDDLINGKDGRDEIWAGGGLDTVTGGAGADLFVFDTYGGSSYTQLRDFKHGIDHIGLVETGAADGPLAAGRFHKGTKAQDQNDLVIYNRATGRLWLDFDGDGDRPKMLIATLTTKPVLSASDFVTMGYTGDWWDL